jgi:hypothetical protein
MNKAKSCECPDCEKRAQVDAKSEEMGLAILIMLMPVMTLTLLSNAGLF